MLEIVLDRFTLQNMEKKPGESYKKYAIKWKIVASQVRPALTNRETNSLFVDTLSSLYYNNLIGNIFLEFEDLMYSIRRIEDEMKR